MDLQVAARDRGRVNGCRITIIVQEKKCCAGGAIGNVDVIPVLLRAVARAIAAGFVAILGTGREADGSIAHLVPFNSFERSRPLIFDKVVRRRR